jgi:hypothetical protein
MYISFCEKNKIKTYIFVEVQRNLPFRTLWQPRKKNLNCKARGEFLVDRYVFARLVYLLCLEHLCVCGGGDLLGGGGIYCQPLRPNTPCLSAVTSKHALSISSAFSTCVCVCVCVCITHTHTHTHTNKQTHTNTHKTNTHTHTHTHTHTPVIPPYAWRCGGTGNRVQNLPIFAPTFLFRV